MLRMYKKTVKSYNLSVSGVYSFKLHGNAADNL